ncbi:hypothetical protein [Jiella pacifica]|uniref:MxaH protein n=1 Tax=Jiella pacifica TaxID=2696469 RepID=A0A6N9TAR4_9HYPH|nr:hypothetical protein [Jiella pacifica]NDW05988.1 hypothetical protein [Jiella pacifica]
MSSLLLSPRWKLPDGVSLIAFVLVAGMVACDDAPVVASREEAVELGEGSGTRWHALTDPTPIPLFLARAVTGRQDLRSGDPAVRPYAEALRAARGHYIETDRMLANRLIQAAVLLAERGEAIDPLQLLDDLVARSGSGRRSFGTEIHHYLNLREEGVSHAAAIERLDGALAADAADPAGR